MPTSKKRHARGNRRAKTKPATTPAGRRSETMEERVRRLGFRIANPSENFDKAKAYSREISPILSRLREACAKHGLPTVVGVCYGRTEGVAQLHIEAMAAPGGWQPTGIRRAALALRSDPILALLGAIGAPMWSLGRSLTDHMARSLGGSPDEICGDRAGELDAFLGRAMALAAARRAGAKWSAATAYGDCRAVARGRGPTRKTALADLRADLASWGRRQMAAGAPLPGQPMPRPNPAWLAAEAGFASAAGEREERKRGEEILLRVLRGERR